jgi:hypothetical protein
MSEQERPLDAWWSLHYPVVPIGCARCGGIITAGYAWTGAVYCRPCAEFRGAFLPVERTLAPGWEQLETPGRYNGMDWVCTREPSHFTLASYVTDGGCNATCEACAPAAGVFATGEPVKACEAWCGKRGAEARRAGCKRREDVEPGDESRAPFTYVADHNIFYHCTRECRDRAVGQCQVCKVGPLGPDRECKCTLEADGVAGLSAIAPGVYGSTNVRVPVAAPAGESAAPLPQVYVDGLWVLTEACEWARARLAQSDADRCDAIPFNARCSTRCFVARRHVEPEPAKVREWKAPQVDQFRDETGTWYINVEADDVEHSQVAELPTYSRAPWLEPRWRRDREYVGAVDLDDGFAEDAR